MAHLNLSFLDTFQVLSDQKPITHFRSTNNQGLLVYLVFNREKQVSRESLMALFWPDESEQNARNNLRQSLYQLRKLLGDTKNGEEAHLTVTRQTVQFNQESDYEADVQAFLHGIDTGDLETAVSHYQGELLPGFTCDSLEFESWLRQEREHLHNLALETMAELTRDYLQNGRYDKAQTTAQKQIQLEPWREQAHRQLMQAFTLGGNRNKALQQFELCQATLQEELGVAPTEETITLFEDIKSGRLTPAASTESVRPPIKTKHNLPTDTTPLIGRELEIEQISQRIIKDKQRLITILGPGGMGKTRLGLAVGRALMAQFADGVYFVDLAPLVESKEIPLTIGTTIGYLAPDRDAALFPQLLQGISQQNILLILDNFEHLLEGAAFVNEMLQACPDVTILVTSRQRLNLASESRFELGGLDFPDWLTPEDAMDYTAVQLFMENARRAQPDFKLTQDNIGDITHICQQVQGMPLGLVLAASWLELLSPADISQEIDNSLDFLAADLTDLPARQRSMQAIFNYSWQMMTPAEQTVMAKLSVFRGGFTREAAEQVAGANLRILLALVNKSLLQRQAENGRFAMHELLRQFAAAQRQQVEKNNDALLAHCRYYADFVYAHWWPVSQTEYMILEHAVDKENLSRAWEYALENGLAEELGNLVLGIMQFNMRQGVARNPLATAAIEILRQQDYPETARVMLWLRLLAQGTRLGFDDSSRVKKQLLKLVPEFEMAPYPELEYSLYSWLGALMSEWERDTEAISWSTKGYEVACAMGDEIQIKRSDYYRIHTLIQLGLQDETTKEKLQTHLAYFESRFPKAGEITFILSDLQTLCNLDNAYEDAIHYGKRSLNIAKQWQDLYSISTILYSLADTYLRMEQPEEAKKHQLDALEWHLAIGQIWQTLGFLYSAMIKIPQFINDKETTVSIFAMIYHHHDVVDHHKQLIDDELPHLEEALGTDTFNTAWAKGKAMDFDTAVSIVRTSLKSPSSSNE